MGEKSWKILEVLRRKVIHERGEKENHSFKDSGVSGVCHFCYQLLSHYDLKFRATKVLALSHILR